MLKRITRFLLLVSILFTAFTWSGCSDDPTNDTPNDGGTSTDTTPAILEFSFLHLTNESILKSNVICDIAANGKISTLQPIPTKTLMCSRQPLTPSFKVNKGNKVYVNNREQFSGESSHDFTSPVFYKVVAENGAIAEYSVELDFANTGLPIVSVKTSDGQDIVSKENWVKATISIDGGEEFEDLDLTEVQIAGRGNSTWNYAKKPYKLKFGSKTEILGMPKHKRWVLLANYIDKTMLRNDVAFYLGKQTSLAWTPRGYHVELILNGVHKGNYYLCEQIKIDKNRVNITELKPDSEDITGGYLMEMDTYSPDDDETRFYSKYKAATGNYIPVKIKDPEAEDLSDRQLSYIKGYFHTFEDALYGNNWLDKDKGYKQYIDMDSFIDIYLVSELIYHSEWGHPKSSYMHKDAGGKLASGPMWDYDWTTFTKRTGWYCKNMLWYQRMFQDPEFIALLKQRWTELYPKFFGAINYMRVMKEKLSTSAEMNYSIWDPSMSGSPNGEGSMTYGESVDKIIDRYHERIEWLNQEIEKL